MTIQFCWLYCCIHRFSVIKCLIKMEEQQMRDEGGNKKIRHRKKQLFISILEQMEFYFSDSNINKDRFLAQLLREDKYVDLSIFLKFNKIRTLTTNIEDICKALRKSEKLQLSEDNLKVCRVTPIQEKTNQDECTIYVERVPADVEHDWLKNIFSKFGTVDYVSIPKYKHNKMIKGFAFIEFSKPDEAQKVLEYFESIGCKLPTKMPPDQLISIATFESDNSEKDIHSLNNCATNEKQDQVDDEVESKTDELSTTSENDTNKKSTEKLLEESENLEVDKSKKRKISASDDTEVKKKTKNENEDTTNAENEEVVNNEEENGNDEESVDKKKRKRKKSHKKTTVDIKQIGLKVLSKREWKQLRNKYLNLQRQKMQNLKEHLNRTRFANNVHYTENTSSDRNSAKPQKDEPETAPKFKYTPGTIIQFELPEECVDIKKFKANIRTNSGVEFIDIGIGSAQGYIRFTNSDSTQKFLESSFDASMQILQGDEEKQYWDKIIEDREMKLKKDIGKKQRGRDKLLRKAEKALGKHIRFDNAE